MTNSLLIATSFFSNLTHITYDKEMSFLAPPFCFIEPPSFLSVNFLGHLDIWGDGSISFRLSGPNGAFYGLKGSNSSASGQICVVLGLRDYVYVTCVESQKRAPWRAEWSCQRQGNLVLACKTGVFARERYKMNDLCLSLK